MPFTFAHPAAAIPLLRPLGRYGVLSALIIGSCMPDVAYFSAIGVGRETSHSVSALFWYCLPIGLICYLLFHWLIKGPVLALMPAAFLKRLGHYCHHFNELPKASWLAVVISLLIGATSHIIWDAFTHSTGPAVRLFPILRMPLFTVDGYLFTTYKLLQHLSTVGGISVIIFWIWRWYQKTPTKTYQIPLRLNRNQRLWALCGVILMPILIGLMFSTNTPSTLHGVWWLRIFIRHTIMTALPTWVGILMLYSVTWHIIRISGRHKSDPRP